MGFPADTLPSAPRHYLAVREARLRLPQLVAMMTVTDRVTVLTDDRGRPAAALVPVQAARTVADMQDTQTRAAATAAGWERRLEAMRAHTARQHAGRMTAAAQMLAQAWQELDQRCPPGSDPRLDRLRVAHRQWLDDAAGLAGRHVGPA
jgi:antitoxin (DNA-binding transcriptional repressor) of toxin-antitoxin stability system